MKNEALWIEKQSTIMKFVGSAMMIRFIFFAILIVITSASTSSATTGCFQFQNPTPISVSKNSHFCEFIDAYSLHHETFKRPLLLSSMVSHKTSTTKLYAQSSETLREEALNGQANNNNINNNNNNNKEEFSSLLCCAINFADISAPFVSRLDSESTFVEFDDDGTVVPAGRVGQFKEDTANFLREPAVEIMIAGAVLINSLLVALSTLDSLMPYMDTIRWAENSVSILFCIDFLGRWFSSSKEPGRHILDPQFALDVMVVIFPLVVGLAPPTILEEMLPSWLTNPSGLFNLELLRVLRLRRVLKNLDTFEKFMVRGLGVLGTRTVNGIQEWQLQLCRVLLSIFTLLSVATGLIYTAEHSVNPSINNYFDALYFGLTTLTTVGFGDVTPVTSQGKLIVCGSILVGVAVVPAQAAALVEALLAREQKRNRQDKDIDIEMIPRNEQKGTNSQPRVDRIGTSSSSTNDNNDGDDNDVAWTLDMTTSCPECGATFHWTKAKFCHSCGQPL